jgi:NAD(P)-dependent dehydrogenase (short-subunit alcohol dehydrogenase family)
MKVQDLFSLKDKVAIVTGGGRGIGQFMARGLAEAGANVVVASRKLENCQKEAEHLQSLGVQSLGLKCDMANDEDIKNLVDKTVETFGKVDVLINNSGITWGAPTTDYPIEKWDKIFSVNVRGVWLLTQSVAKLMKKQKIGSIIMVTSVMGERGAEEMAQPAVAYNASKGAINTLTKDLAIKLAPYKIRVNAIAPGFFATDMMGHIEKPQFAQVKKEIINRIPLSRVATEEDVKALAVFLASDASAYVTGAILNVDGGYLAK